MAKKKTPQQVTRAYEKAHPETVAKDKARGRIEMALKKGTMKKPTTCPNCHKKGGRIEYDHQGKPPGWKCSRCHPRGGAVR